MYDILRIRFCVNTCANSFSTHQWVPINTENSKETSLPFEGRDTEF